MSGGRKVPTDQRAMQGNSFATDFTQVGTNRSASNIFTRAVGSSSGIVEEERRLIKKVFSIVDKDNSGSIDVKELQDMFKLFGVDSSFLTGAISRIMTNVDKDFDGMISPEEFYSLLSQKFEKGDSRSDINTVFKKMKKADSTNYELLDVDDLHAVAQMLGENLPKTEIKDMIKTFSQSYKDDLKKYNAIPNEQRKSKPAPEDPKGLTMDDFYAIMQEELA
eukprot:CAMPEP_0170608646 /NCGR_PEP_ID=MMETSP0224-20130122/21697_1 /TAXON_ID=285029 /ORGANISM="Togula jolla, Strain CCCM 725" /LENGTH=220 /DNA_ID=CAMNT_0010933889 /DNA_START=86 /DNA_END=748 /DNA_ORIENTATION=-